MRIEGPQGVLVVSGHEHHDRQVRIRDRFQHRKAVERRHLHVEKHEIRLQIVDEGHGFVAVASFAHDGDILMPGEVQANALARQRLIVDDQRTDCAIHTWSSELSGATYSRNGSSTVTHAPRSSFP